MENKTLIAFMTMLLFCSCNSVTSLQPQGFVQYVDNPENGYKKQIEAGDYTYTMFYKPIEYIAIQENGNEDVFDTMAYKKRLNHLKKTIWFNVYVGVNNSNVNPVREDLKGLDDYNQRIGYFLREARNNFRLRYKNEISSPIAYHFENSYGLTPQDVIVIGFSIKDETPVEDIILEYDDMLFKNEMLKAKFTKDKLLNIPNIYF